MLKLAAYPEPCSSVGRGRPGAARRGLLPARRGQPPFTATTPPSVFSSTMPNWRGRGMALLAATAASASSNALGDARGVERAGAHVPGQVWPPRWKTHDIAEQFEARLRQGRAAAVGSPIGLIVGLLIGLALALGVALYITKAPVPFINKVPQRTAEQDTPRPSATRPGTPTPRSAARPLHAPPVQPRPRPPVRRPQRRYPRWPWCRRLPPRRPARLRPWR